MYIHVQSIPQKENQNKLFQYLYGHFFQYMYLYNWILPISKNHIIKVFSISVLKMMVTHCVDNNHLDFAFFG